MADTEQTNEAASQDIPIAVVTIPQIYAAKVLEFVEKLEQQDPEADVMGHMMSRGVMAAAKGVSGTGCHISGVPVSDFHCSDVDEI